MKYIINYKEFNRGWSSTSYYCSEPVSDEYLVSFFGLYECEEYIIKKENNK